MRRFQLAVPVFAIFSMILMMLAACGDGSSGGADEGGLKIVIVSSGSSVDDGGFQQDNYYGIIDFIEQDSPESSVSTVTSTDIATSLQDVESVVADHDVMVLPGFPFAVISSIALEYPEKYFILIDAYPDEIDGQSVFDNIYAMMFKEQESGFFAGIAAAMETTTGKVAFIGGIAFPSVVNYQFGFDAGVRYANENLGTNAEITELAAYSGTDVTGTSIGGNYGNDFGDPMRSEIVAQALINEGCDILFVAAGGSGLGAFAVAIDNPGVMIIGCDTDQYDEGAFPGGNVVLTSGYKNMRINVSRQLRAIADGTFSGGNYLLGADTDSTGFVSAQGRHQLSAGTLSALNDAYAKVKSGEIQPPGNFFPGNLG